MCGRKGEVEISQNTEEERKSARKILTGNYAGCLCENILTFLDYYAVADPRIYVTMLKLDFCYRRK